MGIKVDIAIKEVLSSSLAKLEELIADGYSDKDMLIKEDEIQALSISLQKLSGSDGNKGYTIPLVDTIGMDLLGKFSSQIENI